MLSGFGHLLIGSVLSNKQSLILGHSRSDWDTPTELINIRKVRSDVSVPRMKLLEFGAISSRQAIPIGAVGVVQLNS
jgi:muramoyltetrapeptide carboxypeptidase LdcA involved in peptidoglycan recycling